MARDVDTGTFKFMIWTMTMTLESLAVLGVYITGSPALEVGIRSILITFKLTT